MSDITLVITREEVEIIATEHVRTLCYIDVWSAEYSVSDEGMDMPDIHEKYFAIHRLDSLVEAGAITSQRIDEMIDKWCEEHAEWIEHVQKLHDDKATVE